MVDDYSPDGSPSSSSPGDCLRVFRRYMDRSAGTPSALVVKTCRRIRFADTPSDSKSSSEIRSSVDCDTTSPPLVARSITLRGDVDVDAEPVRTDPLRSTGVHAGPHPRRIAFHVNGFHCLQRGDHRTHRCCRVEEHRHDAVAHPLDDVAAGLQQRRLDDLGNPAQQLQGGFVARPQRPGREADQVGEHQRHLTISRAAGDPFGQRLPELQRPEADLARRGVALEQPVRGARRGTWSANSGGG